MYKKIKMHKGIKTKKIIMRMPIKRKKQKKLKEEISLPQQIYNALTFPFAFLNIIFYIYMSVFEAIIYKIVTVSHIKIFKTNIFCLITGYWQLLGHLENNYMFHHYKLGVFQRRQNYG